MIDEFVRHPYLTARFLLKRIWEIPEKGLPRFQRAIDASDTFDRKYGVETSRAVQIVPTNSPNFLSGSRYSASPEAAIRWSIENCGVPYNLTTFIDLGCGKGRALIVAAMYPFKKIIGVEYAPDLASICHENLRRLSMNARCEVIVGDAVDVTFPDGNLLVFLYNPFDSTILSRVLANMAMTKGNVRIAQLGPGHDVIQRSGIAREILSGVGPTLYEILNGYQPEITASEREAH